MEAREDDAAAAVLTSLPTSIGTFCYPHFQETPKNVPIDVGRELLLNFAGDESSLNNHLGDHLVYAKLIGLKTFLIINASKMTKTWLASYGHYIDLMDDLVKKALGRGFGNHVEVTKNAFTRIKAFNTQENLSIKIKLNTVVMKTELPRRLECFF